jgi:hypothetical protein
MTEPEKGGDDDARDENREENDADFISFRHD